MRTLSQQEQQQVNGSGHDMNASFAGNIASLSLMIVGGVVAGKMADVLGKGQRRNIPIVISALATGLICMGKDIYKEANDEHEH